MALVMCSECKREISTLAALCLGCGAPQSPQLAAIPPVARSPSGTTSAIERRITERFKTQRPFADVKALIGKAFASIEPKFSVETLSFEKSGLFVNASLTPVDDGYLLVVDHNYFKQSSSPGIIIARFVFLGLLWYFGGIWLALTALAVFGLIQSHKRFSADRIEQCVASLKNIVG